MQCRVDADGKTEEMEQVKLSGLDGAGRITWAGDGVLAASTSDQSLRCVVVFAPMMATYSGH